MRSHVKRTDFLCSLGFELHRYSGTRDEINTPGREMETGLMHGINRLEWLQPQNNKVLPDQTFQPAHITFPHRKLILWDGHGNQNAVTKLTSGSAVWRCYESQSRELKNEGETIFHALCGLDRCKLHLYIAFGSAAIGRSKITNATPLLLLDNVEHLLMTYSCSTSSQTLHTSPTISAVSALRKCLARSDLGSWHACDLISQFANLAP